MFECDGVCEEPKGVTFKLMCPGKYAGLPNKVMVFNNGKPNRRYAEMCQDPIQILNVGYNNYPGYWDVKDTNTARKQFNEINLLFKSCLRKANVHKSVSLSVCPQTKFRRALLEHY